jgi:hypothetical protein
MLDTDTKRRIDTARDCGGLLSPDTSIGGNLLIEDEHEQETPGI